MDTAFFIYLYGVGRLLTVMADPIYMRESSQYSINCLFWLKFKVVLTFQIPKCEIKLFSCLFVSFDSI